MDRAQIDALIERQARAWEQGNIEALLADFAPDALFITPGGTLKGHQAIRKMAESALKSISEARVIITRIIFYQDEGAVEWTWRQTDKHTNIQQTVEDAIIFTLREDKITYWREYFDPAQMNP
jgi:uncharacterized protein (TIGR02246 family)